MKRMFATALLAGVVSLQATAAYAASSMGDAGISTTGYIYAASISATSYAGDGSGLSNLPAGNSISSGTTSLTANSNGYVSLTTGGVTTGYLNSAGLLVLPGISTTTSHGISSTNGYFSGNVGIGTAPAGSKLVVLAGSDQDNLSFTSMNDASGTNSYDISRLTINAGALSYPEIYLRTADTSSLVTSILSGGNLYLAATTSNRDISLGYNGNYQAGNPSAPNHISRMYIDNSTGNIGIGTTTPQAILDISGTYTQLRLSDGDSAAYASFVTGDGTPTGIDPYMDINLLGGDTDKDHYIRFFRGANTTGNVYIDFLRGNNTTNSGARISTNGGDNWFNIYGGNSGIGTTTPEKKLHIKADDATAGLMIERTTAGTSSPVLVFRKSRNGAVAQSGDGLASFFISDYINSSTLIDNWFLGVYATETRSATAAGNSLYFRTVPNGSTTSVDRMFIDHNGNVGIGTTDANNKLTITTPGDITAANAGGGVLIEDSSGNASGYKVRIDVNELQANNDGTAANFTLNPFGGGITIGATAYTGNLIVRNTTTTCTIGSGTGNTSCTSDRRMKKNIEPLHNSLEKIIALQGVSFTWKKTGEHTIGLIAQDVEKQFPELVTTDAETGMKGITYPSLVAPLIEAVKTLKTENDTLKAELQALRADVEALKAAR